MQISHTESLVYQVASKKIGMSFTKNGEPVSREEAFSGELGLPLFCLKSKAICLESGMDKINIGMSFVKEEKLPYGFDVMLDEGFSVKRTITRVMFMVDAIIQLGEECDLKKEPRVIDLNKLHHDLIGDIEKMTIVIPNNMSPAR